MSMRSSRKGLPAWCAGLTLLVSAATPQWAAAVEKATDSKPGIVARTTTRANQLAHDVVKRAGANSPRFSPAQPSDVEQFGGVPELRSVFFEFDKSQIRHGEAAVLDRDAGWLKANAPREVLIAAYADERGTSQYNLTLAERRAQALKNELVQRGIPAERIVIASYGEGRPACSDKTDTCWEQKRRADILVRHETQKP